MDSFEQKKIMIKPDLIKKHNCEIILYFNMNYKHISFFYIIFILIGEAYILLSYFFKSSSLHAVENWLVSISSLQLYSFI